MIALHQNISLRHISFTDHRFQWRSGQVIGSGLVGTGLAFQYRVKFEAGF